MEYELLRENRKSVGIYITREARVLVKAPKGVLKRDIDVFVGQKRAWIEKHLQERRNILSQEPRYGLEYGGKILLLGREIPVLRMSDRGIRLTKEALFVQDNADFDRVISGFGALVKDFAFDYFEGRLKYYGALMGLDGFGLRVSRAKCQWGSCNSRGVISLSLRLIGADCDLIDYVVVHELAHLVFMNHQEDFWALVASVIPDFKGRRERLRLYQVRITPETFL